MIDVRELYVLQVWFSNRQDWVDIKSFDIQDEAFNACDAARSVDGESRFRVVRRWH